MRFKVKEPFPSIISSVPASNGTDKDRTKETPTTLSHYIIKSEQTIIQYLMNLVVVAFFVLCSASPPPTATPIWMMKKIYIYIYPHKPGRHPRPG